MTTEQILIELVTDTSQLESAIDELQRLGTVDGKVAAGFKAASADMNKQTTAIKNVAGATKGNLDDIVKATKNVSGQFAQAFQKGIISTLAQAGVSVEAFEQKLTALNESNPAFSKLSKSLTDTISKIHETTAALDALEGSGGAGTAAFAQLEDQLIADQEELKTIVDQINDLKKVMQSKGEIPSLIPNGTAENLVSVERELRALVDQIARAKASGLDYGESYEALVQKAAKLKDALGDVRKEVKNVASDTSAIDGLISATQGIAGGFAVAQGTMALFGDESEEMQKTLLKVNAVMAIMQGLQAIQNTRLKESSALQLINTAATKAQAFWHGILSVAIGKSTGAAKAFRIAFASTGIGLLILALAALVANWDKVAEAINGVSKSQKDLAATTEKTVESEEKKLDALKDQDSVLQLQGKTEKQILESKVKQVDAIISSRKQQILAQEGILKSQIAAEKRNREILSGIINFLTIPLNILITAVNGIAKALGSDLKIPDVGSIAKGIFDEDEVEKEGKAAIDELKNQLAVIENEKAGFQLNIQDIDKAALEQRLKDQVSGIERQLLTVEAGSKKELELQLKLIDAKAAIDLAGAKSQAERDLINTKRIQERNEAEITAERNKIQKRIEGIELELKTVEKGTREELRLKQQLLKEQAAEEITTGKKTQQQKDAIVKASNKEQLELAKEHYRQLAAEAIANQISLNNAEIQSRKTNDQDRLLLQISNIELAAQAEIDSANGNAAKIKEIISNRDADILETKKNFLQDAFDYEMELAEKRGATAKRQLEELVEDERKGARDRLNALQELTDTDVEALNKRKQHLRDLFKEQQITEKAYKTLYQGVENEITAITDKAAKKRKEIISENTQGWVDIILDGVQAIGDVFQSLGDIQTTRDSQRIEMERKALQDAKESGSITEREAISRAKRIDAEERKLKIEAAKREKAAALFSALINIARAVSNMLATNIGPQAFAAAALAAGIATAQAIAIAARPIPKFRLGKKDRYEGLGEVGEAGTEIIEREGRMYVVKEPTITWLGAKDKVYTPYETFKMMQMNKPQHVVNKMVMNYDKNDTNNKEMKEAIKAIQKVEKAISKLPIHTISFDENGFQHSQQEGLSRINYNEKRYRFGG